MLWGIPILAPKSTVSPKFLSQKNVGPNTFWSKKVFVQQHFCQIFLAPIKLGPKSVVQIWSVTVDILLIWIDGQMLTGERSP